MDLLQTDTECCTGSVRQTSRMVLAVFMLDPDAINVPLPLNKLCLPDTEELAYPFVPASFSDNFWTRVDSDTPIITFTVPLAGQQLGGRAFWVKPIGANVNQYCFRLNV